MERDVADARSQVAAIVEAEKKSIERAKAADKKLEEAKIVFSASKQEAAALQTKIKSVTAELSSVQAQFKQASSALAEETRLRLRFEQEVESLKSQTTAASTSLQEQMQSVKAAHAESKSQAEKLQCEARALQEEVASVRTTAAAEIKLLEAKLVETEVALASQTAELRRQLNAAESSCSVQQQQRQLESARQEKERAFVEQKLARLEEQQCAAASAQSAAAAAHAEAEREKSAASERSAAVAAVFKKMANLDEGLEGDCTCLQCMQALADPVLLQVTPPPHASAYVSDPLPVRSFSVLELLCHRPRVCRVRCGHPAGKRRARVSRLAHRDEICVVYCSHAHYQKPVNNSALGTLVSKLNFRRQVMEQLLAKHAA